MNIFSLGDQTIKINNDSVDMAMSENEEFKRLYQDLISDNRKGSRHAANRSIRKSLPQKTAKNPWKK